ncbi:MAG TPA: TylF/MycF/NovP-related O-methyltransferase [Flavobacteriales bacterium]|nr:TylF/MycF/NovP-related O-methyltransferase [Flavobacteriales bacterium]
MDINLIQGISLILILILFFLGFKLLETRWSFKISKPWAWENAVKNGKISNELIALEKSYRDKVRFYSIWYFVEQIKQQKIDGAIAELGVYKGDTAFMLHVMDSSRPIFLFDTFDGFKENDLSVEKVKDARYSTSNFSDTSLESVKKRFIDLSNIHFHPGYFPESANGLAIQTYAFVHLDADLYLPTLSGLQYFYPLLAPGGMILIHDFNHTWEGVKQAVDEFSKTIPENFIPIADWQGSVVLIKNKIHTRFH